MMFDFNLLKTKSFQSRLLASNLPRDPSGKSYREIIVEINVNYCDGLGRCFRFVCIYSCADVFFVATVFFGE